MPVKGVDTVDDIYQLQFVIALFNRLNKIQAVVGRAVVVGHKDERLLLRKQMRKIGPAHIPPVERHSCGSTANGDRERVTTVGIVVLRIVQDAVDFIILRSGPSEYFAAGNMFVFQAGIEPEQLISFREAGTAPPQIQFTEPVFRQGGCGRVNKDDLFPILGDGRNRHTLVMFTGVNDTFAPLTVAPSLVVSQQAGRSVGKRGQDIVTDHFETGTQRPGPIQRYLDRVQRVIRPVIIRFTGRAAQTGVSIIRKVQVIGQINII